MFVRICHFFQAAALVPACLAQTFTPSNPEWNRPVEPFRIAGNLYYVGANDVTSFLLTSDRGHVLIDSGFRETVPQIVANVQKLGFRLADVKYILNTQAHFDHAAGLAELKRLTGAKLLASREDAALLARGGKGDFAFQDNYLYEPVEADEMIEDRHLLQLGDITMKAYLTPGHTKGCTTWTAIIRDDVKRLNAAFVCSVSAPGYRLLSNPAYPNIIEDYRRTFDLLAKLPCDIYLSAHAGQFRMADKLAARAPGRNPFVDKTELATFIRQAKADFQRELKKQESRANGN